MISYPFIVLVFGFGMSYVFSKLQAISKIFAIVAMLALLSLPAYFSYVNVRDLMISGELTEEEKSFPGQTLLQ